jgi:hypothetical protein
MKSHTKEDTFDRFHGDNRRETSNRSRRSRLSRRRNTKRRRPTRKHRRSILGGSKDHLPLVVGRIFSIGCSFCETMEPEWIVLKDKIKKTHPNLFNDIEASNIDEKLSELNTKYGTNVAAPNGFPTIYKIVGPAKGPYQVEYYNGPRTQQEMYAWIIQGNT